MMLIKVFMFITGVLVISWFMMNSAVNASETTCEQDHVLCITKCGMLPPEYNQRCKLACYQAYNQCVRK